MLMIYGMGDKRCGLLGEHLGHSYSPLIHSLLADYSYTLFEMPKEDVGTFLRTGDFYALNVTIPYKKTVMRYLDGISPEARKIGSVNTIVRGDMGLYGDNTDYYGFRYLVGKSKISVPGRKVLILGTGGASLTAEVVMRDLGAEKISFVSRSGGINYENVYSLCQDTEIIVNCTPVGMYPENGKSPISLSRFEKCVGVIDMIYNPARTELLLDAKELSIPGTDGLPMLVAQAKRACELFLNTEIEDREIDRITKIIRNRTMNIILVGMPGCGKSTVGRIVAERLDREFLDSDIETEKNTGIPVPEIINRYGEEKFRQAEHETLRSLGKLSGKVIATGGGVVTRARNYRPLAQNGVIFFIRRELSKLPTEGRPLSLKNNLAEMYEKRLPLYRQFADCEVENEKSADECAESIIGLFGE